MLLLRAFAAATLLLASAPAVPQTSPLPIDTIARAKFPHEPGKMIDALAALNIIVNASIVYEDDKTHYGIDELWVMFPKDGKGDCEDYALTKLGLLAQMHFPIVTNAKIVGVAVGTKHGEEGHAILALLLPKGEVVYLDSLNDEPMTRAELVKQHYRFSDWRA